MAKQYLITDGCNIIKVLSKKPTDKDLINIQKENWIDNIQILEVVKITNVKLNTKRIEDKNGFLSEFKYSIKSKKETTKIKHGC